MVSLFVCVDTSVFGGAFDAEFFRWGSAFFDQVAEGKFMPVISQMVSDEIADAPFIVRELYSSALGFAEVVPVSLDAKNLANAYLEAGIVPRKSELDAMHVALATVSGCAAIVSWNFRHIVHREKIHLYNAINRIHGYNAIDICSPAEVIKYGT